MKTGTIRKLAAAFLPAACFLALCGCSDSWRNPGKKEYAGIHLFIEGEDDMTRTSFHADETCLPDIAYILFYDTGGALAFWTEASLDGAGEVSCDIGGIIPGRDYLIYAIAGIDIEGDIGTLFATVSQAESFTLSKEMISEQECIPYAHVPSSYTFVAKGGKYEVPLKRILAKYNFRLDRSRMTGSFTATSLTVRQSPGLTRPLLAENSASSPALLKDGDAAAPEEMSILNEGGTVSCYLLENCHGDVFPGNGDPWGKVPENMGGGTGNLATYVEICGNYHGDNISVTGLKYRFFLGEDAVSNCDVRRNTVRTVTLSLTDENTVLKESWKVVRGSVEESRRLSFGRDSVEVFPYPGRTDTVYFDSFPPNLGVRLALDSSRLGAYPFSVSHEGNSVILRCERFIPQERTTLVLPVILSTGDNIRRDTLNVAYYSLDKVSPYVPFRFYANFTGIVCNESGLPRVLYKATSTDRSFNRTCFKTDLDYNGVIKSCWNDAWTSDRDTLYETGLVLTTSDSDIISVALSPTNPTLWYLTANGLGTARITATYSMGGTHESGFSDVAAHILNVSLDARPNIGRGESCQPGVRLFNELGDEWYPYEDEISFSSSDTGILTDGGVGVNNGTALLSVRYGYPYPYNTVTDGKEITVSGSVNTYELYIVPDGQQTIYAGESCRDTVRLRHLIDGELISDREVSGSWSLSDSRLGTISPTFGKSVTVTGKAGSATPLVLSVRHYCEDGNVYTARKNIFVMQKEFFTDRQHLQWSHDMAGVRDALTVNVTATASLPWNVSISGTDADCFSFSPASGSGSQAITVFPVSINESREADRSALLTFSAEGLVSRTVELLQLRDTTGPGPGPGPGPDPDPDPDPDPVVHDTTYLLSITPSDPPAITHHGSTQMEAWLQRLVDGLADGAARNVTSIALWSSSNTSAATVSCGTVQGCNYSAGDVTTVITATYDGLVSNEAEITVGGLVITRYLELLPSLPQTIAAGGSLRYTLLLHTVTDGADDGGADVTDSASWRSSNTAAATVAAGTATGCNTSENAATTTITAVYEGMKASAGLTVEGTPAIVHTLEISTSQSSYFLNSESLGQDITVLYDGVAVEDPSAISWNISRSSVIDGIIGFQPHFVGPGTCTVSASYGGATSNDITFTVGSLVTKVRLEITSMTISDGHNSETFTTYLPPRVFTPGDCEYLNGESAQWCSIAGGTYYDTDVSITVNLYITTANSQETLASTRTFTFGAMRGDVIPFTESDWPELINGLFFSFNAVINID